MFNRLFALLATIPAVVGCTQISVPPASLDELRASVVTMYHSFDEPGESGVAVGFHLHGREHFYVLTAGHVLGPLQGVCREKNGGKVGFGVVGRKPEDGVRRVEADWRRVPMACVADKRYDIGCCNITDGITAIEQNGGRIAAIDMDLVETNGWKASESMGGRHLPGVGIALREDYGRLGIAPGTELAGFCSDVSLPNENTVYSWTSVIKTFKSRIVELDRHLPVQNNPNVTEMIFHVIEGHAVQGNSGGPVFAMVDIGGKKYPFLIGVVSGACQGDATKSVVTPIDAFAKEIKDAKMKGMDAK